MYRFGTTRVEKKKPGGLYHKEIMPRLCCLGDTLNYQSEERFSVRLAVAFVANSPGRKGKLIELKL